jgi:hypothetical protein
LLFISLHQVLFFISLLVHTICLPLFGCWWFSTFSLICYFSLILYDILLFFAGLEWEDPLEDFDNLWFGS